ncbi:Tropomyosin [Necator americanus]|uniref:Tropomyosin n=1 Tax=Necator americanus TaxID=51031 RepID=W2TFG0_NECAM|nr:Tropomyosin [Necator americanus]ETN79931.1 Tropomyosin [Necator americanus]
MSKVNKEGAQQTSLLDVLKKKMRQAREEAEAAKDEADEAEAEVAALNRRIVLVEEDLERTEDRLKIATSKLEEAVNPLQAEAEVAALNRRMTLLEEELERAEERLKIATEKLEEATQNVDESERARKSMETRSQQDEERANFLETQVDEAKVIAEDADRKARKSLENRVDVDEDRCAELETKLREAQALLHETESKSEEVHVVHCALLPPCPFACLVLFPCSKREVARKLAMVEADLERAEERAEAGENKIVELEEELRVVGNNLKSLELSEEKALEKEDIFADQLRQLDFRMKEPELCCEQCKWLCFVYSKIVELEEELRVVGNNLKSLEVSEEKALQREDSYEEQIRTISARLKEAETRAEFAERSVQKLQKEVDRLEEEKDEADRKNRQLQEELDHLLTELNGV